MVKMNNKEFRVLVKHCFLKGKSKHEAQEWLEKCYASIENAPIPPKKMICRWYEEFQQTENTESTNADIAKRTEGTENHDSNQFRRKRATKSPVSESCLCDICGKVLSNADTRKRHRQSHLAQEPYQCKSCGKRFRDRGNLHVSKSFSTRMNF